MRSLSRSAFGWAIAAGIGLAAGYWWGKQSVSTTETKPTVSRTPARATARPATLPVITPEEVAPSAPVEQVEEAGELDAVLAIKLADKRHKALFDFARRLASQDLSKAIEAFHSLRNVHDKAAYLDGLIDIYARTKPVECLEFLRSLPGGFVRNVNLEKALAIIAETAPQMAAEQIRTFLTAADAHNALIRVTDVWGQTNPREAIGWAALNLKDSSRVAAVEQIASTWAQSNPLEAINHVLHAQGLSSTDRELALRAIAGTWAMSDPEAAIAWAENYQRSGQSSEPLQIALMNLAVNDPAAAARRAGQITDVQITSQLYPAIASTWGSIAPTDAAAWVNTLPAGNGKSGAVMQLAEAWANVDPASAIKWALQIPGLEPAREDAIRQAAMTWDRFNSGQMDEFLRTLTPAQAAEIEQILRSPPLREPQPRTRFGRE